MMKLWMLMMVLVTSTFAFGVGAVVDPSPDILGAYFDTEASSPSLFVGTNTPFTMYFILTSPSSPQIERCAYSYHLEVPEGMQNLVFLLTITLPPDMVFLSDRTLSPIGGYVHSGWPAPVPTTIAVTLLTMQYLFLAPMPAHMTIGGATYWNGEDEYSLGSPTCSGMVNENCAVAVESCAFGAVKALYR